MGPACGVQSPGARTSRRLGGAPGAGGTLPPFPRPRAGGSRWGGVQATAVPGSSQLRVPAVPGTVLGALPYLSPLRPPLPRPGVSWEGSLSQSPRAEHHIGARLTLGKLLYSEPGAAVTVNGGTVEEVFQRSAFCSTTPWYYCER